VRDKVRTIIREAVDRLAAAGSLPGGLPVIVDLPRDESFGDFTTNIAMGAASKMRVPPRQAAALVVEAIGDGHGLFERVEVAGPGFINIFLRRESWTAALLEAERAGARWGDIATGGGRRVQVEFVSANPTGPLHVGHGRGAAVGDVLANLLARAGWKVEREYYINDAGRQMEMLGRSLLARYREALGRPPEFPEDGYRGDYLKDVARDLVLKKGDTLLALPVGEAEALSTDFAKDTILKGIEKDLADFGVSFDRWASERELLAAHPLAGLLDELEKEGLAYRQDDALWLRTTSFGDDKDRVLVRSNGQATYFANDILYHREKFRLGYDRVIDIWGADHHGYVERMKAAVRTLGREADDLGIILVQLVRLLRGGQPVAMSTRAGEFDTLRQVMDEVGRDAARFFFVFRKADAQLDFDLELAVRQSSENPVYYVQYAHARIHSIFRKMTEAGTPVPEAAPEDLSRLTLPEEAALIRRIVLYPDVIALAADNLEPHRVAFAVQDLASRFHTYYNQHRVLSPDERLTAARLFLVRLIGRVLAHGLGIIGVSAPESM
jgi:arginyl-tRNA synthetase